MSAVEFLAALDSLGLGQAEAAQLLSVTPRTVRRWIEGEEVPGTAEQVLRAWMGLHRRGLAWRPDETSLASDDSEQIAIVRTHAIDLEDLLKRVEARGGPSAPWTVDLDRCRATLGPLQLSFYKLQNGGFAPQSYRRSDELGADTQRDGPLIEDALVCIARALAVHGKKETRQRLTFIGPSVAEGKMSLWSEGILPPVVAIVTCQDLRTALGLDAEVSDAKCRVLAAINKDFLTGVAEALFAEQRFEVGPLGIRKLEIGLLELEPVAKHFSLGALKIDGQWGVR